MSSLKQIREQYHLSQSALAATLGVSRTLLSMAELGLRSLPTPAFFKLQELISQHNSATAILRAQSSEKITANRNHKKSAVFQQQLAHPLAELRYQLEAHERKLERAEMRYKNAMNRLELSQAHRSANLFSNKDLLQRAIIEGMEARAHLTLYSIPDHKLELLRIKIETIRFEIVLLEKLIGM